MRGNFCLFSHCTVCALIEYFYCNQISPCTHTSQKEVMFTLPHRITHTVLPTAAESLVVTSISTNTVSVQWEMNYRMKSFTGNLLQEVSWRVATDDHWTSVSEKTE